MGRQIRPLFDVVGPALAWAPSIPPTRHRSLHYRFTQTVMTRDVIIPHEFTTSDSGKKWLLWSYQILDGFFNELVCFAFCVGDPEKFSVAFILKRLDSYF